MIFFNKIGLDGVIWRGMYGMNISKSWSGWFRWMERMVGVVGMDGIF